MVEAQVTQKDAMDATGVQETTLTDSPQRRGNICMRYVGAGHRIG